MLKKKILSVCLAMVMILVAIPGICAKAASYSGSGTMADPYLVQTAEQLQGMRDNLSAHYKLANTIDLSSVDFKPVGRLDAPFTGSLVCELNADLTPKYIIKNLKVTVAETSYAAENKNKWEAAMFGATDGATISGIYVLDAKISNNNFGDNTGGVQYGTYKPGMDEMNSAILIGDAKSTTVTNCGVTGTIDTRANWCGGLIGNASNSVVENCYSTADVKSTGKWNIGSLFGGITDSTVTACFATGNAVGSQSRVGSFAGVVSGTFTDCYATGNASGAREGTNAFTTVALGGSVTFTNCFALGTVDTVTKTSGTVKADNCWALSGKQHGIEGFSEGSLEQIKTAFARLSNWDVAGAQPQIKTIGVVTDASKYVPSAVQTANPNDTTTGTTSGTIADTTAGATEVTTEAVTPEKVAELIEALPDPLVEGSITIEQKEEVKEAWRAYEALSTGEKDEFDTTLYGKLTSVRYKMSILVAGELVTALKELPEVDELTTDYNEEILSLWDDYTFLDENVAVEIDEKWIEKLEAAYEFVQKSEQGQLQGTVMTVDTGLTEMEKVIVIVCCIVIILAVLFNAIVGVVILCRMRKLKKKITITSGDEWNDGKTQDE